MGLFDKIFKKPKIKMSDLKSYFKLMNGYTPVFTSYDGGVYEMELTRSAIHAFATHCSKLKPEVIGSAYPQLKNILKYKPNDYMDTSKFLYRLATILSVQNTAFIVPIYDFFDNLTGYYPILPNMSEITDDSKGNPWLVYHFSNGEKSAIEFEKVGILTQHQYKNDITGENNRALNATMQLLHTQNEGIIEGVKNSASIRFMAKASNMFGDDALKELRDNFTKLNLSSDNKTGLLIFDNQFSDIEQVKSEQFVINAAQQKLIQDNVFNYFGVNQKILQNDFDEDAWNAFYEGKIEPFALQLSLVMTNMTYSQKELSFGNEIQFSGNRLQYASNTTKLNVVTQLFDRGMMTQNMAFEIFNMPPIENGNEFYIRGEYINIKDKDKTENNYQGEDEPDGENTGAEHTETD